MKKQCLLLLCLSAAVLFGFADPASASCTATVNCANSCSAEIECPPPFQPWYLACSGSAQVITCTGPNPSSTCSSTANSVTCDGKTKTCSTNWCKQTSTSVTCGTTTKTCQQCENGPLMCPL